MDRAELAAWLRLVLTDGLGDNERRKLLAAFGLPQAILEQSQAALEQVVPAARARLLLKEPADLQQRLEATLEWLAASPGTRRIVTLADAGYPAALLQTEDPPLMLYMAGRAHESLGRAVAIVGSRNPTPQGRENAKRFGHAFAEAGVTVVSGLALGIDGAAHEGAIEGAAPDLLATVAVVGTGLDRVYPRQHHALAHRIAERGLLVSEYPIGTPPIGDNFPRRNRIIAALSQGTLVVEAALKSGSLITARLAAEQGKDVFAVPGSIHSPQSRGCHQLLRQGAKLVESAQDVLEDLRWVPASTRAQDEGGAEPAEGDDALLAAMGYEPVSLDALIARTGIPAPTLQAQLLELELAGHVARLPGGLLQRTAAA
ncbi:DNA-processing protein DprA [Ramlibacter albus]|uniref:DNA-protecting protein DprA n=1 Tax=Ramlibacter albus TaxID=2079448 RepID=A0A923S3Z4_9BURK|nr:DNA-processing protein DprA [Ramlibacter albus]MBC5763597.1 DNA-protecting protein DprA [Ramlibacter albus]